ncbi:MAG: hypothetical protein J0M11_08015, partial [Anaerolineae bacterium]|nr:hypothetical protein [Anaerolineae bacterium]
TKRAPDAGDSAVIPSSFLRLIIFLVGRLRRPRPSAGNANRWVAITMKKYSKISVLTILLGAFLLSCNTANVIQIPLGIKNQTTPTVLPMSTNKPTITSTATLIYPTPPASYATLQVAQSTAEALGNFCVGAKKIYAPEISPNGKWIAANCYSENGTEESPLQASSIDGSKNWKIYYSDYIFSPILDKMGLSLDRYDSVIPAHWSKDGRFLFATVGSRLDGCCWITGSRRVLLVRLNLETGEQIALLRTDYYSANVFSFIISDSDRYLLFTPPSYNLPYDFAVLDFQTWETQEIILEFTGETHMDYAKLSPKEDKVILPLFYFIPYDDYYLDSIVLIDLTSGMQDILISDIKPEGEIFPIQWIDNNHVLMSNINPVYYAGDKIERRWILDINSGQLEERTP